MPGRLKNSQTISLRSAPTGELRHGSDPGRAKPAELHRWFRQRLPARAAVIVGPVFDHTVTLAEAEARAILSAVDRRRFEFSTGRHLARCAVQELGLDLGVLPMLPDRRPAWPPGLTGSISHAGGLCVAIVAEASAATAVGADIEQVDAVGAELDSRIAPPEDWAANADVLPRQVLRACLFSAREAVYKAYHPATGARLDFHDLTLRLGAHDGRFTARLVKPGLPSFFGSHEVEGHFGVLHDIVATLVLRAPPG